MELNLELPEFLTRRADGEIVVTGTRVTLYHVISTYRDVQSVDLLHEHWPHIPTSRLAEVVRFRDNHVAPVDAYIDEYDAELDRQYEAGRKVDLPELKRRLETGRLPAA